MALSRRAEKNLKTEVTQLKAEIASRNKNSDEIRAVLRPPRTEGIASSWASSPSNISQPSLLEEAKRVTRELDARNTEIASNHKYYGEQVAGLQRQMAQLREDLIRKEGEVTRRCAQLRTLHGALTGLTQVAGS